MNAQLPGDRQERVIGDMLPGDSGWTVPWAMYADECNRLWLNSNYTLSAKPGGTVQMQVWLDEHGWHVDASRAPNYKWSRGGGIYVGAFQPIQSPTRDSDQTPGNCPTVRGRTTMDYDKVFSDVDGAVRASLRDVGSKYDGDVCQSSFVTCSIVPIFCGVIDELGKLVPAAIRHQWAKVLYRTADQLAADDPSDV